ncbi:MAG: U32 family peptidase [Brevundimonas sp.]|uniref:ubiquinone anaerobic biosynthesis protein UbiV n=1 Tax=Brevundimonas sp. TaxID=1871086 RepID=UPI0027261576|nr:U32 family peptidase [Brevundimonas sp.]MDO9077052.1 U32 family peptidase [Brevundimonas sp.]MDP3079349.1 U32 family peptidase [Brevundimonas sp.]MDZ4060658.1 U32 family peptidase [Brevundimonas sp.]
MELAIGPLLFNWAADRVETFYARIADEAPVGTVYLGEVVCGKRQPLLQDVLARAAERLEAAGKTVIWSTLALPSTPRERRLAAELAADPDHLIEAGDMSAVWSRAPAPFVAGPLLNVYNAPAAAELVRLGCVRLCANVELPLASIAEIAQACPGLELELFAFGRLPLALSSRCAQARMEGLHRDACRYVCDRYPDGMDVATIEGQDFLAVNGLQTLSHGCQLVDVEVEALRGAGVSVLRLSPHSLDMVAVAHLFHDFVEGEITPQELGLGIALLAPPGPLVSGYLHGAVGARRVGAGAAS